MEEKIKFTAQDGTETEFYVLEETRLGGRDYLLVAESDEDEAECLILKDISSAEDADAVFVPVEDDTELDAVAKVFRELLDEGVVLE